MQIAKNTVVSLDYSLTNDQGQELDKSSNGDFAYLHGASNIIPGLEEALAGKSSGDELSVSIPPEQAYGERNDALVQDVSRDMFPASEQVEVGKQFHAQSPDGHPVIITVVNVDGDNVKIDGNHPLAGETLNFQVKVVDVREASEEEIAHGHAHGPGGHHHE